MGRRCSSAPKDMVERPIAPKPSSSRSCGDATEVGAGVGDTGGMLGGTGVERVGGGVRVRGPSGAGLTRLL